MTTAAAAYEDVPALRMINHVQAATVASALAGGPYDGLPLLSLAAPFSRTAVIPAGPVSIRDVAGLYPFDNTLLAVVLTGAQLRDYLEYSAGYFTAPRSRPAYNYDVAAGHTAALAYTIDATAREGSRIRGLAYDGAPVEPSAEFVVATNNYRQAGSGGFPHIAAAPVVHDAQQEIRQALIDWVTARATVSPEDFPGPHWRVIGRGAAAPRGVRRGTA